LIYYNTVWQPLSVRLNETAEITEMSDIEDLCRARGIQAYTSVFRAGSAGHPHAEHGRAG
jgi:hypothetical protein